MEASLSHLREESTRIATEDARVREEGEKVKREREVLERNREKLEVFGREIQQRSQEVEEMCKVCVCGRRCMCVEDNFKNEVKGCLYSLFSFPY